MLDLLLDIDGVLCDHATAVCMRVNRDYGVKYSREDVTEWDFAFRPEISFVGAVKKYYADPEFIWNMSPMPGAVEFVKSMKPTARITIASAREECCWSATQEWIDRYFPGLEKVRFVKEKSRLAEEVLVDDNEDEVFGAIARGKVGVLFLQPWNRSSGKTALLSKRAGAFSVDGFASVLSLLNSLQERGLE